MINIEALINKYGYPLYVYDEIELKRRTKILKYIFEDFSVYLSLKANPNKNIIKFLGQNGIGADCASVNEVKRAIDSGINSSDILYSSPGKTVDDIKEALGNCTIVADSLNELSRMNNIFNEKTKIGVRINPKKGLLKDIAFETMGGVTSKFGIDEDLYFNSKEYIDSLKNIDIVGIHVYIGSGILEEEVIIANFENIFGIASRFDRYLEFIDFGGGLGVPYEPGQKELDVEILKKGIKNLKNKYDLEETKLIVESGRFLTATCGRYLTKITDIKDSLGKKYYIIQGGMNGFFRPAFTKTAHKINVLNGNIETEKATVAGHLCTPIDVQGEDVIVNKAEVGDIIEIRDAGAYGYTMSLIDFISHRRPIELYVDEKGEIFK